MEKIRYFILMALCVIGITSCQDDLTTGTAGADVNKPVKVDLKFGIPKSMQVEVTRADNSYSGMYGVRLYVFSENNFLGEPQQKLMDDGTLTVGSSSDQGQTYTAHNVTLYEGGKQMVYAIGNITRTGYWDSNVLNTIDAAAKEGLSKFKEVLYTLSSQTISRKTYPSFVTAYMPLSGSGEVTVENNSASGVVTLKRIVSQIKFEITTSQEVNGKTVTFEPNNYAFHNIATQAYVLDGIGQEVLTTTTYDANPVNIAGAGDDGIAEFSVYLPENIQTAKKTGAGDYDDRESFSGQGENKDWTYAPDNSTYVVISGVCTEKDSDGNLLRYGNVEYTIHLGDFSANGSMDDFSVERNCIYTYKVSVQGMDKIKVEAEKKQDEEYQNGAEGDVIEMGTGAKIFNVDAHYEQVFVEYNLSDILSKVQELYPDPDAVSDDDLKTGIADQFRLVIHTPLNTEADRVVLPYSPDGQGEEVDMAGIDYKWVEFYPQSQDESISPYPGQGKTEEGKILYSPYQVCRMMGDAIYQLYKNENSTPSVKGLILEQERNGDWVARFTIFIDEYFYTKDLEGNNVAWDKFTRQDPRTMMIASDMKISDDLNSTYSQAQTYISQQAIQTFYNPDAAYYYNALGIETYNETGIMSDFSPEQSGSSAIPSSTDHSKGRDNMLKNMEILPNQSDVTDDQWTYKNWNAYIDFSQVGYTDDNSTGNNRWSGKWNAQTAYAYYACMSRNRDLNGDGRIDPTEVRWYLPALSQYLRMGIGVKALPAETRLFTGDASTMTGDYPNDYLEAGSLYFVNTSISADAALPYTIYWAVEVGAYGSPSMADEGAMIRCVRNLPNLDIVNKATGDDDVRLVNRDAWAGPVYDKVKYTSDGNMLFDFGDRLVSDIFRNSESQQYGPYDPHDEQNEEIMKLPGGFVVAKEDLYIRNNNPSIPLGLYDGSDSYDRRGAGDNCDFDWSYNSWPYYMKDPCSSYYEKSGELGVWRTPNLNELMVMSTVSGLLRSGANTYSRTQFTQPSREIFYYNTSGIITTSANEDNSAGYIRCVRDATQAERDATQPVN